MEITPLGDSALIVRVRNQFEDAPEQTSNEVLRALRRIEDARIPGVIELAPAYTTAAVLPQPVGTSIKRDLYSGSSASRAYPDSFRGGS